MENSANIPSPSATPEPAWKARLRHEAKEARTKSVRLANWLLEPSNVNRTAASDLILLRRQAELEDQYATVLEARVARL